jgi:predicted branched-subunit amino acid permease
VGRGHDGAPAAKGAALIRGIRAGLPFALPTALLAVSFGVLAAPLMGTFATVAMSMIVYAGTAQFAALSVLLGGGGAAPAAIAGLLVNARFLPMGVAAAPSLHGGLLQRAAEGQSVVDVSWAMASDGKGRFDRELLIGATIPQYIGWVGGTIAGALAGDALGNPEKLGLDAIFPAFYLALLVGELRDRRAVSAALLGGAIALALLPVTPAGIPVVAASLAALTALRAKAAAPEAEASRS